MHMEHRTADYTTTFIWIPSLKRSLVEGGRSSSAEQNERDSEKARSLLQKTLTRDKQQACGVD